MNKKFIILILILWLNGCSDSNEITNECGNIISPLSILQKHNLKINGIINIETSCFSIRMNSDYYLQFSIESKLIKNQLEPYISRDLSYNEAIRHYIIDEDYIFYHFNETQNSNLYAIHPIDSNHFVFIYFEF